MMDPDPLPQPPRWIIWVEDGLILLALVLLWLPILLGYGAGLVRTLMWGSLLVMLGIGWRRLRRINRLFDELRRRQEEEKALGYPTMAGMIPPPRIVQPPDKPVSVSREGNSGDDE